MGCQRMRCEAGLCLPEGRAEGKRCLLQNPRAWRVGENKKAVTASYVCSVFLLRALNQRIAVQVFKARLHRKHC